MTTVEDILDFTILPNANDIREEAKSVEDILDFTILPNRKLDGSNFRM